MPPTAYVTRRFQAMVVGLLAGGGQIGARRSRISRAIQMLGMESAVAFDEPGRGPLVQLALAGGAQRGVNPFLNQDVREQVVRAIRADQPVLDQGEAPIIRVVEQMAHGLERKALPKDRRRLDRGPVARRQAVQGRPDQALHGVGDSRVSGLGGAQ